MADRLVLGIDEAGYGPNLGPLCVAASVWRVIDDLAPEQLYAHLEGLVSATPAAGRLAIGDSKQLYRAADGLARLEGTVLGALCTLDRLPNDWRGIWPVLDPQALPQIDELPWHDGYNERLPCSLPSPQGDPDASQTPDARGSEEVALAALRLKAARQRGVHLVDLAASVLFPRRFNQELAAGANKADLLLEAVLGLVARVLARVPDLPAVVLCDRLGGRKRYLPQVQRQLSERVVCVQREDDAVSQYAAWESGRPVSLRFQVDGEQFLPVALASMTAKYLRELAMRPFNAFWQRHLPGLAPTAGYPVDARRFLTQIEPRLAQLDIPLDALWRQR
jgi:ribonuclease HII